MRCLQVGYSSFGLVFVIHQCLPLHREVTYKGLLDLCVGVIRLFDSAEIKDGFVVSCDWIEARIHALRVNFFGSFLEAQFQSLSVV